MANGGTSSPCGACKFLRRKCTSDCIFAPYFASEHSAARFAAIHKIFGASNVSKLLSHVPIADRYQTVFSLAYEAQARLQDPVLGCVSHIFALQRQVANLHNQLMQVKAQISQGLINANNLENQWPNNGMITTTTFQSNFPSSIQTVDPIMICANNVQERDEEQLGFQSYSKMRQYQGDDLSELQEIAFRMTRN